MRICFLCLIVVVFFTASTEIAHPINLGVEGRVVAQSKDLSLVVLADLVYKLHNYRLKYHAYPLTLNKLGIKGLSEFECPQRDAPTRCEVFFIDDRKMLYYSNQANYKLVVMDNVACELLVYQYPYIKDRANLQCAYGYWTPIAAGWH